MSWMELDHKNTSVLTKSDGNSGTNSNQHSGIYADANSGSIFDSRVTPTKSSVSINCEHLYIISSTGGSVTYSYYNCSGGSTNGATTGPAGVPTDTGNCGDANQPIINVTGGSAYFTGAC